jgi:hypothetical protein
LCLKGYCLYLFDEHCSVKLLLLPLFLHFHSSFSFTTLSFYHVILLLRHSFIHSLYFSHTISFFCSPHTLFTHTLFLTFNLQLLFIERLLYSAEIKYVTAYLLTEAAIRNEKNQNDVIKNQVQDPSLDKGTDTDLFSTYAASLKAYSIINAALCRSHRSVKKHTNLPENNIKSDENESAIRVDQSTVECVRNKRFTRSTSLAEQCMYLTTMDTMDLIDSITIDPGSVCLRFRRVAILEKLQK